MTDLFNGQYPPAVVQAPSIPARPFGPTDCRHCRRGPGPGRDYATVCFLSDAHMRAHLAEQAAARMRCLAQHMASLSSHSARRDRMRGFEKHWSAETVEQLRQMTWSILRTSGRQSEGDE